MALDLVHDGKPAVSDLTDRAPGDVSTSLGYSPGGDLPSALTQGDASSGLSGDNSVNPPSTLVSGLGGEDGATPLSPRPGLDRPVAISFTPPATNGTGGDAGPGMAFTPPLAGDFTGNFGDAAPPTGGGTVDFSSNGAGNGHGGGGSGGGGGTPLPYSAHNAFGLTFNISWDSSVGTAPSGFVGGVETAVQYFLNTFSSPITITINVGWGEVAGQRLSFGALGESETNIYNYQYSQLYGAMSNEAHATNATADQVSAVNSLPNNSTGPITNAKYWISSANAKALGLALPSGATNPDGWVGFGNRVSWYFGSGTQSSGQYDFVGTAEHEISEVMGRIALLGASVNDGGTIIPNGYGNLDLFRYSSAGVRALVGGRTAYLSFDGGQTNLHNFNTTAGGDWGDWQSSSSTDAYDAFSSSGHVDLISASDTRELNVLGYTIG